MTNDIADTLRDLADKLEDNDTTDSGNTVPDALWCACHGDVYSAEEQGWHNISDYVVAFDPDGLGVDSRNINGLSALEGYKIEYVVWGSDTQTDAVVELHVSECSE